MFDNLKRRFNQWLAAPPPDDDYWYGRVGMNTSAGVRVAPGESALQSVAMWACNRALTDTVGSLPFGVFRRLGEGQGKEPAPTYPIHGLLHDGPNERQTAPEFWGDYVTGALNMWGNAYALPERDAKGQVVQLWPLRPDRMEVKLDLETGLRAYVYTDLKSNRTPYIEGDLFHVSGYGADGVKGYSPVELLRNTVGHGIAAAQYGERFFSNNALPERWLEHPGHLSDKALENLKDWFQKRFLGVQKAHRLAILEGGMSIKHIPVNHRDLQFLELLKLNLEDIARIYRVPLHILGHLDKMSFNNVEQLHISFATHTIRPIAVRIEKRVNHDLINQRRFFAEFNLEGLKRGDAEARAKLYSSMFQNASMTPQEIRARESMNPHPNPAADELYVQGATVPLGSNRPTEQGLAAVFAQKQGKVTEVGVGPSSDWRERAEAVVKTGDAEALQSLAREILEGGRPN